MKKLGVLLLVSSFEYFDHLLVKNYAGNGFEKSLFFSLSQLKVQIFIFVFFVRAEHYCTGSDFHCLRGKGADETVKFGRNSCPPILAMKNWEYFYL